MIDAKRVNEIMLDCLFRDDEEKVGAIPREFWSALPGNMPYYAIVE